MATGVSKKTFRVDLGDVDVTISGNTEVADPNIQGALDEKLNITDTASVWASQIDSAIDVTPDDTDLFGVVEDNLTVPTARKFSFASLKSFLKTYFDTLYGGLADLTNHIANISNPHSVTKTQVGLGNVQNVDTTTTSNITDSLNKRFVADSDITKLGNLSGVNTGDETQSSIQTKLGTASTSTSGYLTSTDFNTFNNKQNALGFIPLNKAGDSLSSNDGSGFIGFISQSTAPSTPASGFRLYADSSNALSWIGQNGFTRTFDGTSNTANRTYILPNASGTIALTSNIVPAGSNQQIQFNNNGVFGANSLFNYNPTTQTLNLGTATNVGNDGFAGNSVFSIVAPAIAGVPRERLFFCKISDSSNNFSIINTTALDNVFQPAFVGYLQDGDSTRTALAFDGRINNSFDVNTSVTPINMMRAQRLNGADAIINRNLWGVGGGASGNVLKLTISPTGNIAVGDNITAFPSAQLDLRNSSASQPVVIFSAASSQSADIFQILNSSNVKQFYIDNAYKLWGIDAEFSGEVKGNIYPKWDTTIYTTSPTINLASNNKNYWLNFSTNQSLTLPTNSTITKNIQFNLHFRSTSTGTLTLSSSATIEGDISFSSGTIYILFDTINNIWLIRS